MVDFKDKLKPRKPEEENQPLPAEGSEAKELTVTQSALPALPSPEVLREVFEKNFEGITPTFEIVKVPTGGGLAWTLPGDGDEQEVKKELLGVILDHYPVRAYWEERYGQSGSGAAPKCSSLNGRTGSLPRNEEGEFGECATCAHAQWGTSIKEDGTPGRGQACGLKHRVFFLLSESESIFPILIPVPTMSIKNYEGSLPTFLVKLAGKLKTFDTVKVKVKLVQDKNQDGVLYSKVQFWRVEDLTEEDKKKAKFLSDMLKPAMRQKPFEVGEYEEKSNGEEKPGEAKKDPWE